MAAVTPDPSQIRAFPTAAEFEAWLSANHDQAPGVWLKIHKKDSGLPTVSYAQALDIALCWGWIDGQKKPFDDVSFLQRFTPRGSRSMWSQRNIENVERLITAQRMTPYGLKQVEAAKADGRWQAAYAAGSQMEIPDDLAAAIAANPAAAAMFATLNRQNRFALAFRTGKMKTPAGRARKVAEFVAMLARGETVHPNGKAKEQR